jgi:hypothetical protein
MRQHGCLFIIAAGTRYLNAPQGKAIAALGRTSTATGIIRIEIPLQHADLLRRCRPMPPAPTIPVMVAERRQLDAQNIRN